MKYRSRVLTLCRAALRLVFCALLAFFLPQPARCDAAQTPSSEAATITIDDSQLPIISLSANHARVTDVLTQLSNQLGFEIEHLPINDNQTVTTNLHGELGDVLRSDALGRLNFLLIGEGTHVERLIFIDPEPRAETASAAGTPAGTPTSNAMPAMEAPRSAATSARSTTLAALAATSGKVSKLLRTQVAQGAPQPVSPIGSAVAASSYPSQASPGATPTSGTAPTSGDTSMGNATRMALSNVSTLSAALRAVCVGPACGH